MPTPTPITRDFKISIDSMLQDSRTTQVHFVEDEALFVALDDDFNPPFAAKWLAAIDDATKAPSDEQIVDIQMGFTTTLEAAMEDCRTYFQSSKYKIEKAFPNKPMVWKEFGYDNYLAARQVPEKMIVFMEAFAATATKYKTELIAAKYSQADIDAITTKGKALIKAKTDQELSKDSRPSATQARYALLNAVWAYRTKVAKAAKVIFANDYAKYKLYLLPASEEATTTYSIEGTVTDKVTGKAIADVQVSNGTDTATTDSNGKYGFAKLANGTYTLTFTIAGYKTASTTATFDGTTLALNVALEKA